MPRQLRYSVAMSLDGYIADAQGSFDWILMDPDIDFGAMASEFDTLLMGRGTYEVVAGHDGGPGFEDMHTIVVSRTIEASAHPDATVVASDVERFVGDLKESEGKDIWLFGGGVLFRSLLQMGLVDRVEVHIIPVLLGEGIPLLAGLDGTVRLRLLRIDEYAKTGTVGLFYEVVDADVD